MWGCEAIGPEEAGEGLAWGEVIRLGLWPQVRPCSE